MINLMVIAVIVITLALPIAYIIKAKKSGVKCIGCPASGKCKCGCPSSNKEYHIEI